ncbi:alpha/beta fold hydrolase [Sphingomonas bacterium]|uniref:alpha/beta fold hydrolase n=1 Tax=Sphingomonas bacterium TaxID=1895847 RepID=UPI00157608BA|nr:alpha/beta hydrolase [Sphingomonas bacterium]
MDEHRYQTSGHGPRRLLLIHGWFWDQRVFAALIALLPPDEFTCATFDIAGYGTARAEEGPYDMAAMAEDGWRVAQALGWNDFAVLGHSMGGKAAQKLAIDHADAVRAVIAVTPVSVAPLPFPPEVRAFFERSCGDDDVAGALVGESVGGRLSQAWLDDIVARTRETADDDTRRAYLRSFADDDFSPEAPRLTAPLLVVFGEHDHGVAESVMRPVYEGLYPHARFATIAGVGHYPMLEAPEALAATIAAFLSEMSC